MASSPPPSPIPSPVIPPPPIMPAPTKRVHFDIPPTPSPTLSNGSLESSVGPTTPPQHFYSPYASSKQQVYHPESPVPFGFLPYAAGQVCIHPILVAPYTTLVWDMMYPPSTAHAPGPLPKLLAEPATHPGLPSLTLICDLLPWSITVMPVDPASSVVTVSDVLRALFRSLRLSVSAAELSFLPKEGQLRVHKAFHVRHKSISDDQRRAEERAKGVKRVDFLMEARRFAGLSMVVGGPALQSRGLGEVWAVHLALADLDDDGRGADKCCPGGDGLDDDDSNV
ncbi:uncharacterized protein FIBRA_08085 [Fibroporia radiculosa]|uniref:DUF6699 domain-containing protein n=1 Tax=Fibroporia radiculosa TaxID=599839 RepID=J4H4Z5_9APHY|nr:uncharacterized protein FIBRA_08085 [Fibroporia radiculosa]CCM05849.1 predicted protein [Fibroporia radiculosa]